MSKQTKTRPVETLRDGAMKAAIWKNDSQNGAFYNVTFTRTYKNDKDELHDTDSFSGSQLLQLARLADKAYGVTAKLTKAARAADAAEDDEEGA